MAGETPQELFERLRGEEYSLNSDELAFFQSQTGIQDEEKLKEHIVAVQKEAYAAAPYPCIKGFRFLRMKISRYPAYRQVLKLGKERPRAILLDIGCCFGNDARKAIADGFPRDQVVASDLNQTLWDLGHKLFRSSPESSPIKFVYGDVLSDLHIESGPPAERTAEPTNYLGLTNLDLKSLNPLRHQISAIHASSFFHLFDEETQLIIARKLATLLSPEPGSVIFGSHVGASTKGTIDTGLKRAMFCHSPETWIALWKEDVFKEIAIEYRAILLPEHPIIVWSVTRK